MKRFLLTGLRFWACMILIMTGPVLIAETADSQGIQKIPKKLPIVLKAMQQELTRAMTKLKKQADPPLYFIAYQITDRDSLEISASRGALRMNQKQRTRVLDADVRVGSHELDNTHSLKDYSYVYPQNISLEDDPDAIRAALWLATDENYKAAAEKLIKIKANSLVKVKEEDASADFSKAPVSIHIDNPMTLPANLDRDALANRVKSYSRHFLKDQMVYYSQVSISYIAENKYFVNSEGTILLHGRTHCRLWLQAKTVADDGMILYVDKLFDAASIEGLPDDPTIQTTVNDMISNLSALRKAPVLEPFTGPAILDSHAAAVFFHEIFGHRIEGHRLKDEDDGQTFRKMLNQQVLPPFISIYDDPGMKDFNGQFLNGHYRYDDQGVPAQRVNLVEKGILKNFLMSRSPVDGFSTSNGHGRAQESYPSVSRQGILVVDSTESMKMEDLRKKLIDACRESGNEFGLYFKDVTGGFTSTTRDETQGFNVVPVIVYKVYTDGRPDELVRGVELIGTPLTSFSKILACGETHGIFNGYCGAESGSIPVSAIAPPILTAQIEIQKQAKATDKPPVLPPPDSEITKE